MQGLWTTIQFESLCLPIYSTLPRNHAFMGSAWGRTYTTSWAISVGLSCRDDDEDVMLGDYDDKADDDGDMVEEGSM